VGGEENRTHPDGAAPTVTPGELVKTSTTMGTVEVLGFVAVMVNDVERLRSALSGAWTASPTSTEIGVAARLRTAAPTMISWVRSPNATSTAVRVDLPLAIFLRTAPFRGTTAP
jgi:hypothetical protein